MIGEGTMDKNTSYIDKDDYSGIWSVGIVDSATITERVFRVPDDETAATLTAREIAAIHGDGTIFIMWDYGGHIPSKNVRGAHEWLFCRGRYMVDGERLIGYMPDGSSIIIHPADRELTFLIDDNPVPLPQWQLNVNRSNK